MNGSALRFYMHENQKHDGRLLYEWLLEQARARGIEGGSAFRAIAGFGRRGVMNQQPFFEMAGQQTVAVEFLVPDGTADELLALARASGAPLFYARYAAELGVLPGTA